MHLKTGFYAVIVGLLMAPTHGQAADSTARALLRVSCDGISIGAEVTINGEFKGECPFDVQVPAGTVDLRAIKSIGETQEAIFAQEIRIGGGTVKKIDIILGEPTFTAQGLVIEQERIAKQKRAAEEKARTEAEAKAAALAAERAQSTQYAHLVLGERRAMRASIDANCPDCPTGPTKVTVITTDMPTSADPEIQGMLDRAKQEVVRLNSKAGSDMRPPAESIPIPCEGAGEEIRKLAGLRSVDEMTPALQKRFNSDPNAQPKLYITDVKVWPVQAACIDGKLDGPLEAWVYGTSINGTKEPTDSSFTVTTIPTLMHIQTIMTAGKATGLITLRKRSEGHNYFSNASTMEFVRSSRAKDEADFFTFSYENPATQTFVSMTINRMPGIMKKAEPQFSVHWPHKGEVLNAQLFFGKRLISRSFIKNGMMHGLDTSYEYDLTPDVTIPASVVCYRDGEKVTANPCVFD